MPFLGRPESVVQYTVCVKRTISLFRELEQLAPLQFRFFRYPQHARFYGEHAISGASRIANLVQQVRLK